MKTTIDTQILFAAAKVAEVIGISAYDLQKLHPDNFGVPGHWQMNGTGAVIYTDLGLAILEQVLVDAGQFKEAARLHALLVEEQQARSVPSRQLIVAAPKSTIAPYYQTHPTLS